MPGGRGSAPGSLSTWKTMTPLAREAARQQASLFSCRASKGLSPCRRRHSSFCFLTFTQLSLVADDCKKPRRIHERLPRTHSRPGARPWTKTPSSSGTCSKPATPKLAPGLRGPGCAQEKLNFIFLEKAGRCLRPGSGPRPSTWKNTTPAGARSRAPTGVIVFFQGFPAGLSPLVREAFFLFA